MQDCSDLDTFTSLALRLKPPRAVPLRGSPKPLRIGVRPSLGNLQQFPDHVDRHGFAVLLFGDVLLMALPVPRGCVYETRAAARERRGRLAAIVLTGVLALIVFDVVLGQGGVMAGLLAGLLGGTGVADRLEARTWERAEAGRETRLFALIRHDALTVGIGPLKVVEDE